MSKAQKKKTTALREASMPQPRTAQPCRCRQFGWPLPRTHAHLFARRWLGACMHFCGRMHASPKSPWCALQQQNGPKECFPNAGYRVICLCADAAKPFARLINSLTTCVCPDPRFRRSAASKGMRQESDLTAPDRLPVRRFCFDEFVEHHRRLSAVSLAPGRAHSPRPVLSWTSSCLLFPFSPSHF